MSVVTKIILDTTEYNRLLSIEKAYKELKAEKAERGTETNQSGSGNSSKSCSCLENDSKCSCTPPLSQIIAKNEQARSIDIPPRGILPSITDPNDQEHGTQSRPIDGKGKEHFNASNFRSLANKTDKWYFLGYFQEN